MEFITTKHEIVSNDLRQIYYNAIPDYTVQLIESLIK